MFCDDNPTCLQFKELFESKEFCNLGLPMVSTATTIIFLLYLNLLVPFLHNQYSNEYLSKL